MQAASPHTQEMEEHGGLSQAWRLNLNLSPPKPAHLMTFSLLSRMAEAIGISWARNFTFSVCSLRGSPIICLLSSGRSRRSEVMLCWAATGQAQAGQGAPRMTQWLSQMASCSLHGVPVAISMPQDERPQRVSSELCSLWSPGLRMSRPFCLE